MFRMGIMTMPMLGCFTFLTAMTVSPVRCAIYKEPIGQNFVNVDIDSDALINNDNREERSTESKILRSGMRVGEYTPVYIAYRPDPKKPVTTYTMYDEGIVKEAINEWKAREPTGWNHMITSGFGRNHRSIKENRPSVDIDDQETVESRTMSEIVNSSDHTEYSRNKRLANSKGTVIDVPIFIVMDYPSTWPSKKKYQRNYIKEKIIYAIAFWNNINWRYSYYENPKLKIFIVGIVIVRNKGAASYLRNHEKTGLDKNNALSAIVRHFSDVRLSHRVGSISPLDFSPLLTVTTESKPPGGKRWFGPDPTHPPRDFGIIFFDDLKFTPLKWFQPWAFMAIDFEAETSPYARNHPAAVDKFTGKLLSVLPMPGQVVSPNKQCEHRGWAPGSYVCYAYNPCVSLRCKTSFWTFCEKTGRALDGTFCADGKVCRDGECISNSALIY